MNYYRWYDRDEYLCKILEALTHVDCKLQQEIAFEITQLMLEKQFDTDYFIKKINETTVVKGNRWYDKNDMLHCAVEMLRYIPEEQKTELLDELFLIILNYKEDKLLKKYNSGVKDENFSG